MRKPWVAIIWFAFWGAFPGLCRCFSFKRNLAPAASFSGGSLQRSDLPRHALYSSLSVGLDIANSQETFGQSSGICFWRWRPLCNGLSAGSVRIPGNRKSRFRWSVSHS